MMLRPVLFVLTGMGLGVELINLLFRVTDGKAVFLDWLAPLVGAVIIAYFFWAYRSEGWHRE